MEKPLKSKDFRGFFLMPVRLSESPKTQRVNREWAAGTKMAVPIRLYMAGLAGVNYFFRPAVLIVAAQRARMASYAQAQTTSRGVAKTGMAWIMLRYGPFRL
jgi:hypothetical protein